jgi:hypothetical protein
VFCTFFAAPPFFDRRTVDTNANLQGFLPASYKLREFKMSYGVEYFLINGTVKIVGPENYGLGGATLYTGSGPLWRTKIINWEGLTNNSDSNPNPQPNPDPCKVNPQDPPPICL